MKNYIIKIKEGLVFSITIGIVLILMGTIYASLSSVQPGETLTSNKWNELVGTMNTFSGALDGGLASPTGAVMAFYRDSCPSGWLAADGIESPLDLRGRFIRGLGGNENGEDIARDLGDYQDDAIRNITGTLDGGLRSWSFATGNGTGTGAITTINTGEDANLGGNNRYGYINGFTFDASKSVGVEHIGADNHPKNVALIYCVKE